ncbi:hypothetical protein A4G18_00775 [Pasteurellaceae bacterium Pebbles2]|nr:hypothetical protein [Pasteurellaceae bacterium Pebbles2]
MFNDLNWLIKEFGIVALMFIIPFLVLVVLAYAFTNKLAFIIFMAILLLIAVFLFIELIKIWRDPYLTRKQKWARSFGRY